MTRSAPHRAARARRTRRALSILCAWLGSVGLAHAAGVTLGGYLSGNWYDPAQPGQGFQFEFTDQDSNLIAVWFVFGPDRSQNWIFAQGAYDHAANTVTLNAQRLSGAQFPPLFDTNAVQHTPWGTLTFTFSDCDHAQVSWHGTLAGYGSGSANLTRLTSIRGLACPVN